MFYCGDGFAILAKHVNLFQTFYTYLVIVRKGKFCDFNTQIS